MARHAMLLALTAEQAEFSLHSMKDSGSLPRLRRAAESYHGGVGTAGVALALFVCPGCTRAQPTPERVTEKVAAANPSSAAPPLEAGPSSSMLRVEIPPALEGSCRQICERSRQLNCENAAKCMPNCLAMGSVTPCTAQILRFYGCLVGHPLRDWTCAEDGVAAIREGLCDEEQGQTVACMEAKMR